MKKKFHPVHLLIAIPAFGSLLFVVITQSAAGAFIYHALNY